MRPALALVEPALAQRAGAQAGPRSRWGARLRVGVDGVLARVDVPVPHQLQLRVGQARARRHHLALAPLLRTQKPHLALRTRQPPAPACARGGAVTALSDSSARGTNRRAPAGRALQRWPSSGSACQPTHQHTCTAQTPPTLPASQHARREQAAEAGRALRSAPRAPSRRPGRPRHRCRARRAGRPGWRRPRARSCARACAHGTGAGSPPRRRRLPRRRPPAAAACASASTHAA